jgi:ribosomal protein L11 methyltransferase
MSSAYPKTCQLIILESTKMSLTYHLLTSSSSLEESWSLLEAAGIDILYGSEEDGKVSFYVNLQSVSSLSSFHWIESALPSNLPAFDWQSQWEDHGHNYRDGYVHIGAEFLAGKAVPLRLKPGAGFGDLSHPTTRLVLKFLMQEMKEETVVDVGCGSGILALAAAALNSSHVYGIDIDPVAVQHAKENARLNQLDERCTFCLPDQLAIPSQRCPVLILMNMIQSEQQTAWESLPMLHSRRGKCLTSGILSEERDSYLAQTAGWGWTLLDEKEESGWLAFLFRLKG